MRIVIVAAGTPASLNSPMLPDEPALQSRLRLQSLMHYVHIASPHESATLPPRTDYPDRIIPHEEYSLPKSFEKLRETDKPASVPSPP